MITMKEIAQLAGVSRPTVSLILNGKAEQLRISPVTAQRVLAVARKYDYRPNAMAVAMRTGKTGIVGLLTQENALRQELDGYPASALYLLRRLEAILQLNGKKVLLESISKQQVLDRSLPDMVRNGMAESLISCGFYHDDQAIGKAYGQLLRERCPRLLVLDKTLPGICCIVLDGKAAGRMAAQYFWQLGHRSFAVVGYRENSPDFAERIEGFEEAVRELSGGTCSVTLCRGQNPWQLDFGKEAAEHFLQLPDRPTAILALNDFFARGFLEGLTNRGLSIPRDCSVIAVGNSPLATGIVPALSSIGLDLQKWESLLMGLLENFQRGEAPEPVIHRIAPVLYARNSTAKAAAR